MSKVKDYGKFGKWSIETLSAQTNALSYTGGCIDEKEFNKPGFFEWQLPYQIEKERDRINDQIEEIKDLRLKKLTIGDFMEKHEEIERLQKQLEPYGQLLLDILAYRKAKFLAKQKKKKKR